jgi:hypothetical protein
VAGIGGEPAREAVIGSKAEVEAATCPAGTETRTAAAAVAVSVGCRRCSCPPSVGARRCSWATTTSTGRQDPRATVASRASAS